VGFNPNNIKQIDEAKKEYIEARKEGREITTISGCPLQVFPISSGEFIVKETKLKPGEVGMRIFDNTGDQRLIWNFNDPFQVKEAAERFEKYVKKGWKPYAIGHNGKMSQRIHSFDPNKQEIIFKDKTTKERLKNFAAKFREITMMPRTWPG